MPPIDEATGDDDNVVGRQKGNFFLSYLESADVSRINWIKAQSRRFVDRPVPGGIDSYRRLESFAFRLLAGRFGGSTYNLVYFKNFFFFLLHTFRPERRRVQKANSVTLFVELATKMSASQSVRCSWAQSRLPVSRQAGLSRSTTAHRKPQGSTGEWLIVPFVVCSVNILILTKPSVTGPGPGKQTLVRTWFVRYEERFSFILLVKFVKISILNL